MSAWRAPLSPPPPAPLPPLWITAPHHPWPLAPLERGWKHLQRRAGLANPFLSWEWQSAWAAHLPRGAAPIVVAQPFPDGALAGVLALQWRRSQGMPQLEFLGEGSGGDELDCLLDPQAPPATAARLLHTALRQRPWQRLRLESADAAGALAAHWDGVLPGKRARRETCEWLPTLDLPGSFEEYLALQSPNFRSEVRRRRRRFARQWPQAQVECAQTAAAVAAALPHLFRLHNLRRAQKAAAGIFASPRLRAFHARAAPALAAQGLARLYLLLTPAAVVAALYGLEAGPAGARRFLYFQSGFDPVLAACSPGTVLLSAVIEDCMARGLRRFDFLRGEEDYKARWTRQRHPSVRLLAARGVAGCAWLCLRDLWHAGRRPAPGRRTAL